MTIRLESLQGNHVMAFEVPLISPETTHKQHLIDEDLSGPYDDADIAHMDLVEPRRFGELRAGVAFRDAFGRKWQRSAEGTLKDLRTIDPSES